MKVKEEGEKFGLKLNIQKTKIMASSPITSWQIDGETVEDFIFGGSKITADSHCSHEIKRRLLLGRKFMTNLDSILKSRDITLPPKVCLVKAMVFPVVMYGCENQTAKKAEHRRIDAFELWCWKGLLRVPWTARRSNQSILKELSLGVHWKDWCWSWNSNTLATWWEELTHLKRAWFWGRLRAGGEGDNRGWDGWMASLTQWTWVWVNSKSWWWTGRPGVLRFMGSQRVGHDWATGLNWMYTYVPSREHKLQITSHKISQDLVINCQLSLSEVFHLPSPELKSHLCPNFSLPHIFSSPVISSVIITHTKKSPPRTMVL